MANSLKWAQKMTGTKLSTISLSQHKLGVEVPKGGSSCSSCRYLRTPTTCGLAQWVNPPKDKGGGGGDPTLPFPSNQFCCDYWQGKLPMTINKGLLAWAKAKKTKDIEDSLSGKDIDDPAALAVYLRKRALGAKEFALHQKASREKDPKKRAALKARMKSP